MAWRKPTIDDLTATLSAREVEAFQRSANFGEVDPAERILADTAALVRGYCRSNGNVRMSPHEGEIPGSLVSPAMDYAAYQLLKRMPVPVAQSRQDAKNDAIKIFESVAEGRLTPESHGASPEAASGKVAVEVARSSRRRVTSEKLEGL